MFLHIPRVHEQRQIWICGFMSKICLGKSSCVSKITLVYIARVEKKLENNGFRVPIHFATNRLDFENFPPLPPLLHPRNWIWRVSQPWKTDCLLKSRVGKKPFLLTLFSSLLWVSRVESGPNIGPATGVMTKPRLSNLDVFWHFPLNVNVGPFEWSHCIATVCHPWLISGAGLREIRRGFSAEG